MAKNQNNTEDTQEAPEVVVDSWVISIPKPKIKKIVWGTIATVALTAVGVMGAKTILSNSDSDEDDSDDTDDITEDDVYETWADQPNIPEEER